MHRRKIIPIVIIAILFSSAVYAQEYEGLMQRLYKKYILKEKVSDQKAAPKPDIIPEQTVKTTIVSDYYKNMSKAEIIQEIKSEVDSEEELLEQIPELKREKDKDDKDVYLYLAKGKQINLEDADENILRSLAAQVGDKASKIRSNAMIEQQEQLRMIRSINTITQPPQVPVRPPSVPRRPAPIPER
jgi:hypothetical protein